MKSLSWQSKLAVILLLISALLYTFHYLIFHDYHHIFIYMVGDIAFVPIEVLMVTLILHRILNERERRNRMEKLNMVIGAFFSEVGSKLLAYLSDNDPILDVIKKDLIVTTNWCEDDFKCVKKELAKYNYTVDMKSINFKNLREILVNHRNFLLRLIENPNLLEHETFTDLLMAVFHLTEELEQRPTLKTLPQPDIDHLAGDIHRVYRLLVEEWLSYMNHLKDNYPYLFSLALRTNPFDQDSTPIIK